MRVSLDLDTFPSPVCHSHEPLQFFGESENYLHFIEKLVGIIESHSTKLVSSLSFTIARYLSNTSREVIVRVVP